MTTRKLQYKAVKDTASTHVGSPGDIFYDPAVAELRMYDGNPGGMTIAGGGGGVDLTTVTSHILPSADLTYDLGSTSSQWRSLYVGTSTIYLGGTPVSISGGTLTVDGTPVGSDGPPTFSYVLTSGQTCTLSAETTGTVTHIATIGGGTNVTITATDFPAGNSEWDFRGIDLFTGALTSIGTAFPLVLDTSNYDRQFLTVIYAGEVETIYGPRRYWYMTGFMKNT